MKDFFLTLAETFGTTRQDAKSKFLQAWAGNEAPLEGTPGNWIRTFSGGRFYPFDVEKNDYNIEDIAAGISKQCRYTGQCLYFYSVAEHSVRMSWEVSDAESKLEMLLHDAAEGFMFDLPRPMKNSLIGALYKELEALHTEAIFKKHGLQWPERPLIKYMDNVLLFTEKRDLMRDSEEWKGEKEEYLLKHRIIPWDWQTAERIFLEEYYTNYEAFQKSRQSGKVD